MDKKIISIIIGLMSVALIGIAIMQAFWIKWQVDLNETAFEDKITMVLNQVKVKLEEDFKRKEESSELFTLKNPNKNKENPIVGRILNSVNDDFKSNRLRQQYKSTALFLSPQTKLENIDKDALDNYIEEVLKNNGINIDHDYGIYSNENEDFLIVNGNYHVAQIGESSNIETQENKSLYNSNYAITLFNTESQSPGSLKLFFANKTGYLWSKVWVSLLSSLLFTGLILFCFFYVVWINFRQKKVSEMKSDFINNMTHEFKTPIATISLATDSITSDKIINDESKIKRFASIIKQENKRMLNQVEKVLQMATIDKEEFKLKLSMIDIHDLVNTAAQNMNLKVEHREGNLHTKLEAKQSIIEGDQNHISNIFHNLLDNAEKYSTEKPEITISSKNKKNGIEITVKDNGIGMTKDSLKNIFDKFYRVHTGNRHDVKGFGLGLSYVKALVTAHKGTISVESELNKGSSFKVFFPFNQ